MQKTATYLSTPLQNGLLFNSLVSHEPGVDVIQVICDLPEAIQAQHFLHAWQLISARHETLRTAFRWEETAQPMQEIFPDVTVSFTEEDWSDGTDAECQERLEGYLRQDRQRAFIPWTPPLWRVALIKRAAQLYWCILTFHHAILDGRSLPIVLDEVFTSYRAAVTGVVSTLPPAIPYHDYASWWQQQDQAADNVFWQKWLAGFEASVPLPEDGRHGAGQPYDVAAGMSHVEHDLILSPELSQALRQFALTHELTLNALFQGAWAVLLQRYSGREDILFGEIRSCRHNTVAGAEEMVGFFLNTLPMRIDVQPSASVLPWLQTIRASHRSLRQHQFAPLMEVHQWSQVPPGTPLFTSLFVFEHRTLQSVLSARDEDWLSRRVTILRKPSYPLTLYSFAEPEILTKLVYDPRVFSAPMIERLLRHFSHLLTQMVANPDALLADLSLLTSEERQQMVVEWNATASPYDAETCIHQRIEAIAAQTPEALAIEMGAYRLTYAQLNRKANQLAHLLGSRGVGPEARVGLCMERSCELIVGQLGVLKAGGAFVPLDPHAPEERLTSLLQDAQVTILLTSSKLLPLFSGQTFQTIALDLTTDLLGAWSEQNPAVRLDSANLAYVIYTSGSTGRPKGVAIQHASLANLVAWHQRTYALQASDCTTHLASPAFDASVWEIWPTLAAGASLHLPDQETVLNPRALVAWYSAHSITLTFLPTPLGEAVLQEPWLQKSSLRAVMVGGDRLTRTPQAGAPFDLYNHYGLTETTVVATWTQIFPDPLPDPALPIGRPIDNTETYLLDDSGQPVPIGAVGELFIGGVSLARGYLFRPDLTAERFVPHPWSTQPGARLYRSGDLGRYRSDGQIEFLGRRDQQIKLRGQRIELGEIEATLMQHPDVATALALLYEVNAAPEATGSSSVPGGQGAILVAYVVAAPAKTLTSEELRRFLGQKLPASMVPTSLMVLEALPLTLNGKVDRRALPPPMVFSSVAEGQAPRTPIELALVEIWLHILGRARPAGHTALNIHESFFTLGGHSLLAAQAIVSMNEKFQVHLPIRSLFDAPTIAQMAALITEHRQTHSGEERETIQPLNRSRYRTQKKDERR
ncbi:non-ribosomal peptide synthetase [Tengunoibacter tsumagoiensis]|uniref:Carrier domain-containing protein n=1 Tax=Tengunoibacter tsumagoiensis TaxID=2014871 RepID=A0A402A302_9CHLR|nr:non-ribosomal peptide synthetase [Tengunoibacter tsumagoiensis]GCE13514.1 hypothetical protein KTT_33730 [Tengunoibacter tsumagoiensis]